MLTCIYLTHLLIRLNGIGKPIARKRFAFLILMWSLEFVILNKSLGGYQSSLIGQYNE